MAPSLEITIPTTTISPHPKPHTVYNITLRLPLRTYTLQKRYSDFLALHTTLTSQTNNIPPPAPLPAKHWFSNTINNAALTESRRIALQTYLQTINDHSDPRWRHTSAWRAFLNLPSSSTRADSTISQHAHSSLTMPGQAGNPPITDPTTWLDVHRELKTQLRDARQFLARRDSAATAQGQHEAGAEAKRCLVRAGSLIQALEGGLKGNGAEVGRAGERMGEGEVRRRRDLIGAARKERDGLEGLLNSFALKGPGNAGAGQAVATAADREGLFKGLNTTSSGLNGSTTPTGLPGATSRRVLGPSAPKETDKTRELDNAGVLQLQKQIIAEQDTEVLDLGKAVARMKELGIKIGDELEVQSDLLKLMDEDVERVEGKVGVARKRIGKIK